jgi:4-aminobutyrate aminotransferase-like enzyme
MCRSEANDLAIQLARLHSGGHDVVAVDRAFHGSLILTNDVSPRQYTSPCKAPRKS